MVKFGSNFGIRWYGFSYLLAFFCGFLLLRWLAQRRYCALPPDKVGDFYSAAALGVVVGGRLGYAFFIVPGNCWSIRFSSFAFGTGECRVTADIIGLSLSPCFFTGDDTTSRG